MWMFNGLTAGLFIAMAAVAHFANTSTMIYGVQVTPDIHAATISALTNVPRSKPWQNPPDPEDLSAVRLPSGRLLVCGKTQEILADSGSGFSIEIENRPDGRLEPRSAYIDRQAHRLCFGGRISLLSLGLS